MLPDDLDRHLAHRLASGSLPGRAAQRRFSPSHSYGRHSGPACYNARPAAVMLLIYFARNTWWLPLTLRPPEMIDHAGQVCLPGGRLDEGETSEQAALRELEEEIGVSAERVRILGQLSPLYLYNSNFQITPCLAVSLGQPVYQVNQREVSQLIELPLTTFLVPDFRKKTYIERRGITIGAPYWSWNEYCIWGGTAMILGEFAAILEQCERPPA